MRQEVRFCTAGDGVRLAYAISGNGPLLVRAPHGFTHLEHDWTNPAMRPEKTVRNNITHILDKIGVESRSQAIVLARERGLGTRSSRS
jgi:hypothetical protein